MSGDERRLVIAGGGLAGCLVALALAKLRPEVDLLLVERGQRFGGHHIWSFFDSDVAPEHRWLVDPLVAARWDGYDVRFPRRARTLATGYNSIRSALLDAHMRETLRPDQYRLGATVAEGEIDIDARGAFRLDCFDPGWQKFVGREYRLAEPHGLSRPVVMDASVEQIDGYRFVYCLPFADDRILIEDTYYSTDPALDRERIGERIEGYARAQGWRPLELESEEVGVLPVAMGGEFDVFWAECENSARIGLRGGFFHPTTGYSLPDAVRVAMLIAEQEDFSALPRLLGEEAERLWAERGFYRLLSRLLFRAAEPDRRYRLLEHFYRLPGPVIERFYAARSTWLDKLRILSGRPPVPIGRALRALRS